jgi:hypothetical protein
MHLVDRGLVLKQVMRIITTRVYAVDSTLKFITNTFKACATQSSILFPTIRSHITTKLLIKHNSGDQIEKN